MTPFGYYDMNDCNNTGPDPECNYKRIQTDLANAMSPQGLDHPSPFSEAQVQAVLIDTSDSFPNCDLKLKYCTSDSGNLPDAYLSEEYLGNILRYLKCCTLNADGTSSGNLRRAKLQTIDFITCRLGMRLRRGPGTVVTHYAVKPATRQ
jgi:hypothetical protein